MGFLIDDVYFPCNWLAVLQLHEMEVLRCNSCQDCGMVMEKVSDQPFFYHGLVSSSMQ